MVQNHETSLSVRRVGRRCTLELGRLMRNEHRPSKAQPFASPERNGRVFTDGLGFSRRPTRRDPRSELHGARVRRSTTDKKRSLNASATGGLGIARRRSMVRNGLPVRTALGVAQLGVRAATRTTQIHGAVRSSNRDAYEVQETDGVFRARAQCLQSPSGTGAPTPSRRIGCGMQPTR